MPSRRPRAALAVVAFASLLLAGCGRDISQDAGGEGRSAVAAFFPLQWVTEQVAGDAWSVTGLTSPGSEPHDLELGIEKTAELDRADVVVYERGFQPAVDEAVDNVATGTLVDAAEVVPLRGAGEDEHAHDEPGSDEHDHGETDPHFWLDPLLMADLGDAVADTLADQDGGRAEDYARRAADLRARLEALDEDLAAGLARCRRTTMVVTHDAFGYLERYGLHFEGIVGLTPDAEPTPAALARLTDLIREEGITTVFSERLASADVAETLARDTGVTTAVLDPLEGPAEGERGDDYVALMERNLAALQEAGAC